MLRCEAKLQERLLSILPYGKKERVRGALYAAKGLRAAGDRAGAGRPALHSVCCRSTPRGTGFPPGLKSNTCLYKSDHLIVGRKAKLVITGDVPSAIT
jgi:hypothetical protein